MRTRWIVVPLGLAMLMAMKGFSAAKEEATEKKFAATCPVSGKPAIESSVVERKDGTKVYFCCENCPAAYKKDPKKYMLKVRQQLLETGQIVQVGCPVSGEPVNKEQTVEIGHAKVGFCREKCLAKYKEADEEGKLKLVFGGEAFKKGFTKQTKCPVSGKPIDPAHSVDYKGKKVYFCCPNCPAAFEKDPEKFVDKLPQFAKAKDKKESAEN